MCSSRCGLQHVKFGCLKCTGDSREADQKLRDLLRPADELLPVHRGTIYFLIVAKRLKVRYLEDSLARETNS